MIVHPIPPLFNENSKILILGSFPSVKSRESEFFYGHPQNRFWRVVSKIFNEDLPKSVNEKKKILLDNKIALWDVIASCDIKGSADSSIKNAVPNDLSVIFNNADIKDIFVNGRTAEKYYRKFQEQRYGIKARLLPSTSPANAAIGFDEIVSIWERELFLRNV